MFTEEALLVPIWTWWTTHSWHNLLVFTAHPKLSWQTVYFRSNKVFFVTFVKFYTQACISLRQNCLITKQRKSPQQSKNSQIFQNLKLHTVWKIIEHAQIAWVFLHQCVCVMSQMGKWILQCKWENQYFNVKPFTLLYIKHRKNDCVKKSLRTIVISLWHLTLSRPLRCNWHQAHLYLKMNIWWRLWLYNN